MKLVSNAALVLRPTFYVLRPMSYMLDSIPTAVRDAPASGLL